LSNRCYMRGKESIFKSSIRSIEKLLLKSGSSPD
jgi:hypothetical protein